MSPGKISNYDFIENDKSKYLHGSGKIKGYDSECFDRYIKSNMQENVNYEVVSDKIWVMLSQNYGFDVEVKRYYDKTSTWSNYT